jgi:hypothetical protein
LRAKLSDDAILRKGEYLLSLGERGELMRVELCWAPESSVGTPLGDIERFYGQVAVWLLPEVTHEHARMIDEVMEKHQELMAFLRATGGEPG